MTCEKGLLAVRIVRGSDGRRRAAVSGREGEQRERHHVAGKRTREEPHAARRERHGRTCSGPRARRGDGGGPQP